MCSNITGDLDLNGASSDDTPSDTRSTTSLSSTTVSTGTLTTGRHHLLVLSGHTAGSLTQVSERIVKYAEGHPNRLGDLAYTLRSQHEQLAYRSYAVASDGGTEVSVKMSPAVQVKDSNPVCNFIFTGQGAQWARMGAELLSDFPGFRKSIQAMDNALQHVPNPPPWTIEAQLCLPEGESRVNEPEFVQPLCTAIQIGLADVLRSAGVKPAAIGSHSGGDVAAAYAAGALTQREAITIAYYIGQVSKDHSRNGGLVAVRLGREDVTPFLPAHVSEGVAIVACDNSPNSVTLSGDNDTLETVMQKIKASKPDCLVRRLQVDKAYHSELMNDVAGYYEGVLAPLLSPATPKIPLYSSVTGKRITTEEPVGASHWRKNLASPCYFYSSIQQMLEATMEPSKPLVLLEVGPQPALPGPIRDIIKGMGAEFSGTALTYATTLVRKQHATQAFLSSLGQLHQVSVSVDLENIARSMAPPGAEYQPSVLSDLPRSEPPQTIEHEVFEFSSDEDED
ncbi:hypothetical protein DCS_04399 [Drechmeria coniospora]|uniref:Malonyl-CoA:ACP transacylase (MAT) domain-containing protein n=1 Tax=Drechmeria coniospora TaxID=98403 RepID=A0A151GJW0_DRECN|nr:hypothetical protein DCS_04399 [Drechmeria coniospora]KYK57390.1 hypothetical protein DCS_04399 [Drechmeria coniospora]